MSGSARLWLALVGALQGSALWLLFEWWPDAPQRAAWFAAAACFVSASALVLHMARTGRDRLRLAALAVGIGAAFAGVTLWVAWQLPAAPAPFAGDERRLATWIPASAVALFVLGPFIQIFQASGRLRFPYTELYRSSWNNFFVAALGALFAGTLWTVLFLWMRLFELIGIEVFQDLFTATWFASPLTGGALAYGLAAGRESERILATLRGLTQSLFRALLPLVAAVTLAFLLSLPFTGLEPLFATQRAAAILLAWVAAFALLLNAVYLDGSAAPPYPRALRRLVECGVLGLPVLAAIAGYAVHLRTAQYGVTPERFVAWVATVLLGAYALGYAAAVLRRGAPWLPFLARVNVAMAWVVVGVAFALHTPLLDPLRWSVASQLARLARGAVLPEAFDFAFLRFELGRGGYRALQGVAQEPRSAEPARERELARLALEVTEHWEWEEQRKGGFAPFEVVRLGSWPLGLPEALASERFTVGLRGCGPEWRCLSFPLDLDDDGRAEELVFNEVYPTAFMLWRSDGPARWERVGRLWAPDVSVEAAALLRAIEAGRVESRRPPYRDLWVEGQRFYWLP
jgi:hypothetical protein